MVKALKRRQANPQLVQQLWGAIKYIRQQKQIPNMDRITKYMEREHEIRKADTTNQLHFAVMDGLVKSYRAVGYKGSKVGIEQEGFRLPEPEGEDDEEEQDDEHDWYCFSCHKVGDVLTCSSCWRVYHPSCTEEDYSGVRFVCEYCKAGRKRNHLKKKSLNQLLSYVLIRLKEKTRELYRMGSKEDEERWKLFQFTPMDLNTMEIKCEDREYKFIEEFEADAQNILHNAVICYGEYHGMADSAKQMMKDCKYDLDEIKLCSDCYKMSNAKPKDWFCQPCNPPHELVWAKQKGFCYWPAKVISMVGEKYDVRFFGAYHQRSTLPGTSIKPIDTPMASLNVKKTQAFKKSVEELERHQKIMERVKKEQAEGVVNETDEDTDEEIIQQRKERRKEKKRKRKREKEKENRISKVKKRKVERETGSEYQTLTKDCAVMVEKLKRRYSNEYEETVDTAVPEQEDNEEDEDEEEDEERGEEETPRKESKLTKLKNIIKNRKDDNSTEVSSLSNSDMPTLTQQQQSSAVEDSNLVTSSEDKVHNSPPQLADTTDTSKKTTEKTKPSQEAGATAGVTGPFSAEKYEKMIRELRQKLEKAEKDARGAKSALKDQAEKLQKDFEADKQTAVSRAISKSKRDVDNAIKTTEEKCKEEYMQEMKKLALKHKEAISQTKKKQWCYNCEDEAMYHCCWNTSYCSIKCQQEHWHKEHKKVCRRKR